MSVLAGGATTAGRSLEPDLPLAAMPSRQPPKRWRSGQHMLFRRDYRTTGAVPSQPIGSSQPMPAVLVKPRQIVRGFTYRGAVLNEALVEQLRTQVRAQEPLLSAPQVTSSRLCSVCRGPTGRRSARCYGCDLHMQCAPGSLADVVVPVAFAIKGGSHARCLWQYKSERLAAEAVGRAALTVRALLLVFLHDHGPCLWRAADIPGPTHLAVVPTARGRPGTHPLRALIAEHLTGPWAELRARPGGEQVRDLDPGRFKARAIPGARVLLIDDTWTTGSSAQSAAMALRRAGADAVITVVLGRHVGRAEAERAGLDPAAMPFRQESCPVHGANPVGLGP
jgi:hypothetical protein